MELFQYAFDSLVVSLLLEFPQQIIAKFHSGNPHEHLNGEMKRRPPTKALSRVTSTDPRGAEQRIGCLAIHYVFLMHRNFER